MALTATATPVYGFVVLLWHGLTLLPYRRVQRDIIRNLKLDETHLFTALHPFNRSNLFYEVK